MGEFSRGSKEWKLSKWKKIFLRNFLFSYKKGFSAFAFMIVGTTGAFPALPDIDTKNLILSSETSSREIAQTSPALYQTELCRWQKDFSFFNTLDGEEKPPQETIPCEERVTVLLPIIGDLKIMKAIEKNADLDTLIREMTTGYPLQIMAPAIAEYDRSVAALIVGIAKKESNWGKRVPVDAFGADCFNYWGFKGAGSRGVAMGHGCFGSPEEAVRAVGNRITQLVEIRQTSEPKNMIIWKCGSSCATHSPESVRKWIADVDLYYRQIATQ